MTQRSLITFAKETSTHVSRAVESVKSAKSGYGGLIAHIFGEGITNQSGMTKRMRTLIVLLATISLGVTHTISKSGRKISLEKRVIRLLKNELERSKGGRKVKKTKSEKCIKKK